jgi:hypothetical protein
MEARLKQKQELPSGLKKVLGAYREEIATLQHVNNTLTHKAAEELHQMTDNYNTILDEVVRLGAELARERERHQELPEIVKEYRESGQRNHWDRCRFRQYPDWEKLQDDRCHTCKRADALLETQAEPKLKETPCASGAEKSGTYAMSAEDAQTAETVSAMSMTEMIPVETSTTASKAEPKPAPVASTEKENS